MDIGTDISQTTSVGAVRIQCPCLDRTASYSGQRHPWAYTLAFVDEHVIELVLVLKIEDKNGLVAYKSLEIESATCPGVVVYNRRLPLLGSRPTMHTLAHLDRLLVEGKNGLIDLTVHMTKEPIVLLGPVSPGHTFHVLPKKPNAPRSMFNDPMFLLAEKFYRDAGKTGNHIFKLSSTQQGSHHHQDQVFGHRAILKTRPTLAQTIHDASLRRGVLPQGISFQTVGLYSFLVDRKIFQEVVRYIYCRQKPEHLLFDIAIEGRPLGCWESVFRILYTLGVQDLFEVSLSMWKSYLNQESVLTNYRVWAHRYTAVVETLAQYVIEHASEPYVGQKMMTYMTYVVERCSDAEFLPTEPHKTLMMHIAALVAMGGHPIVEH